MDSYILAAYALIVGCISVGLLQLALEKIAEFDRGYKGDKK